MPISSIQRRRVLYIIFYIYSSTTTLASPNRRAAPTAPSSSTTAEELSGVSSESITRRSTIRRGSNLPKQYDEHLLHRQNRQLDEHGDTIETIDTSNGGDDNENDITNRSSVSQHKQLIEEDDHDKFNDLFFGGDGGGEFEERSTGQRQGQESEKTVASTILENLKYKKRPSSSPPPPSSSSSIRNTVANSIIHDSARTISQVLRGDVAGHVPADIFGQTMKEEIIECNRLHNTESANAIGDEHEFIEVENILSDSNNIFKTNTKMKTNNDINIPVDYHKHGTTTSHNKLYGGAQYHRLLQSYHTIFLTQPIQMNN